MLTYVAAGVLFVIMVVVCCVCVKKCCFTSTPRKQQRQAPAVPYPVGVALLGQPISSKCFVFNVRLSVAAAESVLQPCGHR